MKNTKIEWADHTFNPWIGCTKVSPGCANCYAEARDERFANGIHWGKGAPRQRTSAANWKQPLKWNREAPNDIAWEDHRPRVFCASLADWLDDEVPIEWLADLLKVIYDTPNLDWLLLTKRPENFQKRITEAGDWLGENQPEGAPPVVRMASDWGDFNTPPPNVWIGTTVEDQPRADERIPALLKIPAQVRFLSCEPLLEDVNLEMALEAFQPLAPDLSRKPAPIQWVICGGESGSKARPMHPEWARNLRDQCTRAEIPFFFKQWGEWIPWEWDEQQFNDVIASQHGQELWHDDAPRDFMDLPKGWDTFDITKTADLCQRVGKKLAGRLLDSREWNEVPQ